MPQPRSGPAAAPAIPRTRVGSRRAWLACRANCRPAIASDSTRAVAPLAMAEDATYIDTTGMPIGEVVERVMELVRQKRAETSTN